MQTLHLMEVDDEVQSLDIQSLELTNASPTDSFLKNAHKNHIMASKLSQVARVMRRPNIGVEVEHREILMELEILNMDHNPSIRVLMLCSAQCSKL